MKIGKALDFLRSQALNFVFQNLGGDPSSPVPGQAWFDTAADRLKIRGNAAVYDPTDRATHTGTQAASTIDASFDARVHTSRLDQMAVPGAHVSMNLYRLANVGAPSSGGDAVNYSTLGGWRLNQVAVPTAAVSLNNQRITGLGAPQAVTDAARLSDIQSYKSGMVMKDPVRVQAAVNVNIAAPGATHDGVTLATNDRILLAVNQTAGAERGIYQYNGAAVPLTRTADATQGNLVSGTVVPVLEGATYADTAWRLNSPDSAITVGTTATVWGEFAKPFVPVAGAGITITNGNTIAADVVTVHGRVGSVVGVFGDYTDSLVRVVTNSAEGVWGAVTGTTTLAAVLTSISTAINARALATRNINTAAGSYLTGGGNLTTDRSLAVDAVTTGGTAAQAAKVPVTGAGGKLDVSFLSAVLNGAGITNTVNTGVLGTTVTTALQYLNDNLGAGSTKRYSETLAAAQSTYTVTHNLNTQDLVGSVREVATNEVILADITFPTVNTATVSFTNAQTASANRVTFVG